MLHMVRLRKHRSGLQHPTCTPSTPAAALKPSTRGLSPFPLKAQEAPFGRIRP